MGKFFTGLGGNAGAVLAGAGVAVALGLGAYIGFGRGDTVPVVHSSAPAPKEAVAEASDATTDPAAPSFDTLRREVDGTTIIAGRAAPLSDVEILVDGARVATATADAAGGFAAIVALPAAQSPQIVSLSARAQGADVVSLDEIILAPAEQIAPVQPGAPDTAAPTTQAAQEPATAARQEAPRVAVLKSDEQGVSLLDAGVGSAMTSVALDTIGYSELGEVQLTGRAQQDAAKVRIYLDNRSVISLPVGADGRWRGDLPDVDEGIYTLRVDELTAAGVVSSRVETPFKRESSQVLAQAEQNADSPVTSVTVQTGATLWAIARDRYGDGTLFVRVFEANAASIRNPDLIYPGQVFDLPN
jgi:nucleoid-associated protein YgaU